MFWFTADEHYWHINKKGGGVIKWENRPFSCIEHMNESLVINFNSVVAKQDCTIHAGDFCWSHKLEVAEEIIKRLNGTHIFLKGSHDRWLKNIHQKFIWRKLIDGIFVNVCHYAFRTWERSHYGSWDLHGHSHGHMDPIGKQHDVGVDNNSYFPISFEQLKVIMASRPNHHLIDENIHKVN